jgi:hypothetical protein
VIGVYLTFVGAAGDDDYGCFDVVVVVDAEP